VDPRAGPAPAAERPRHELRGDLVLDVALLLAADRVPQRRLELPDALLGRLTDDGCRQQLLLEAEREQPLPVLRIEVLALVLRRDPAARLHLVAAALLQRLLRELRLELLGRTRPPGPQPVNDDVLEPHTR